MLSALSCASLASTLLYRRMVCRASPAFALNMGFVLPLSNLGPPAYLHYNWPIKLDVLITLKPPSLPLLFPITAVMNSGDFAVSGLLAAPPCLCWLLLSSILTYTGFLLKTALLTLPYTLCFIISPYPCC